MADSKSICDFVIIGGGTAGLVLAGRLSENPEIEVVVLEAGDDKSADPRVATPAMWPLLARSELDWDFRSIKQPALNGREFDCPAGRLLGGTSGINSFLFCPTSKAHIEAWASLGNEGWDWDSFSKAVKKSVSIPGESDTTGPVKLRAPDLDEPDRTWLKVWTETIETLGYPTCDPFSGEVLGATITPESIDPGTGQRFSSANAYLQPALGRDNLTVITGATVSKISFDKGSDPENIVAEGVEYTVKQDDGSAETATVIARKEVILAAGALNSPRLLELSGIGNASLLKSLGIDVVIDNPHVGENLQNHVMTGANFDVKDESDMPSRSPLLRQEPAVVQAAMAALAQGKGPLATSGSNAYAQLPFPGLRTAEGREQLEKLILDAVPSEATSQDPTTDAFIKAHEAFVHSVLRSPQEAPFVYIAANTYAPRDSLEDPTIRPPGKHFFVGVLLAHPLSRGSAHITSSSPVSSTTPAAGLAVDAGYLTHPLDTDILAAGLRYIEDTLMAADPLASHLKPNQPKRFGDLGATREHVRRALSGGLAGGNHWVGTCAMLPRDMGGVVDARLKVYGTKNLRVCDASVVPIMPRGNTMAVVYGMAEKGAELIQASL